MTTENTIAESNAPGPAINRSPAEVARLKPYYAANARTQELLALHGHVHLWRTSEAAPMLVEYFAAVDLFTENPLTARLALEALCLKLA